MILFIGAIVSLLVLVIWLASVASLFIRSAGKTDNPFVQVFAPVAVPLTVVLFIAVLIYTTIIPR